MKGLRNKILLKIALFSLMFVMLTGCVKFKRDSPSRVGTYYPNQSFRVSVTKDNFTNSEVTITLSCPVKIKAVGKMTWNSLMGDYYETALIDGDYYITTSCLQQYGRIEYTGYKTSAEYFWESGWGSFMKLLIFLIIVFIVHQLIKYKIKVNEKKRIQIERLKLEEKERKEREEQQRKEREIERRKNIVIDIANNLYKVTEKEVNKTLIPTLINELVQIYNGLFSSNMNELILIGSTTDFNNIINSIKSELNRLSLLNEEKFKK